MVSERRPERARAESRNISAVRQRLRPRASRALAASRSRRTGVAQPALGRGGRTGGERLFFEAGENEVIDGISRPCFVGNVRHGNVCGWRDESSVGFVVRALCAPTFQQLFLFGTVGAVRFGRRHDFIGIARKNAQQCLGLLWRFGNPCLGL
jgi:hypothetical protein